MGMPQAAQTLEGVSRQHDRHAGVGPGAHFVQQLQFGMAGHTQHRAFLLKCVCWCVPVRGLKPRVLQAGSTLPVRSRAQPERRPGTEPGGLVGCRTPLQNYRRPVPRHRLRIHACLECGPAFVSRERSGPALLGGDRGTLRNIPTQLMAGMTCDLDMFTSGQDRPSSRWTLMAMGSETKGRLRCLWLSTLFL